MATHGIRPVQKVAQSKLAGLLKKPAPIADKTYGIVSDKWFWASAFNPLKSPPSNPLSPDSSQAKASKDLNVDANDQVKDLISKNPKMNVATFLNTLKQKGLAIVDIKPDTGKEADSASSNAPSVRAGVKKNESEPIMEMNFRATKFKETVNDSDDKKGTVFSTVLIQEGLGNLRDGYWYSKEALASAIPVFEGKKIYADHPSADDDENRPERSVRDILGHFENVHVEEESDGRHNLTADVCIQPEQQYDWARGLMKQAIAYAEKYPDKEYVGLSINAAGDSSESPIEDFMNQNELPKSCVPKLMKAMEQGLETVNVVNVIENAVSIDLVTEPGAGGKILKLIEEESMKRQKKSKKEAAKHPAEEEETHRQDGGDDGGDGGDDGGHDDADQDKKLMKSMLKKHLGDKSDGSDEEVEMYKQAYEAHKEMGKDDDDAHEAAGDAMKLAKHMAAKQAEAEGEEEEHEEDAHVDGKTGYKFTQSESESESAMESEVLSLKAEVAKLRETARRNDLEKHIEKLCAKSGLPHSATDLYRAHVKEHGVNTVERANKLWKTFTETYKAAGGEAGSYVISTEKQMIEGNGAVSFSDCLKD